jgi:hypothetical protein
MMSVFAAAIDALFADPNLASDAVYRPGGAGPGVRVRIVVRQPDRIGDFGDTRLRTGTMVFDIRVAEIVAPAEGDTIVVDGSSYVIQGEPVRDAERLVWTIEARPVKPNLNSGVKKIVL